MASIKIKYRWSAVEGRAGSVYFQIIHHRQVRQILSEYKVFKNEQGNRKPMLVEGLQKDLERLNRIVADLNRRNSPYTADDIVTEYRNYMRDYSLAGYMEILIARLRKRKRTRTSETYKATLNSLKKFLSESNCHSVSVMIDSITAELVEDYEAFLQQRGLSPNTTSFYMRIFRAVYNRALDEISMERKNPFKHVYTGNERTVKRALPLESVKKIRLLKLPEGSALDYARDMFMMSFYLRGMSFIDMAYLRKSDLDHGYVTYRRRKTGQPLTIKWTIEMQKIVDKYPKNKTCYLLPVITNPKANERHAYRRCSYRINSNLKIIAEIAELNIPLTLYYARHSWATIARYKGIPLSVISEGMGHDSETTTRIYLASLDVSVVDKANSLIIASV